MWDKEGYSSGFEGGTSGSILKRYAASEADVVQRESFYLETRKDPPKKMQEEETHVRRRIISQLVSPLCLISTLPALLLLLLQSYPLVVKAYHFSMILHKFENYKNVAV